MIVRASFLARVQHLAAQAGQIVKLAFAFYWFLSPLLVVSLLLPVAEQHFGFAGAVGSILALCLACSGMLLAIKERDAIPLVWVVGVVFIALDGAWRLGWVPGL